MLLSFGCEVFELTAGIERTILVLQKEADHYSVGRSPNPNGKKEKSDYGNLIIGKSYLVPATCPKSFPFVYRSFPQKQVSVR